MACYRKTNEKRFYLFSVLEREMKNIYKKYTLSVLCACLVVFALLSATVVFAGLAGTRYLKIPNWRRLTLNDAVLGDIYHQLDETENYVVFGTSRSNLISSETLHFRTVNLASYVYGHPTSVYNFLKSLSRNQLKNIKKIYYMIDVHAFQEGKYQVKLEPFNILNYAVKETKSLSYKTIKNALEEIYFNLTKKGGFYVSIRGNAIPIKSKVWNGDVPTNMKKHDYKISSVEELAEIKKISNDNGIEIIFFTPFFNDKFAREKISKPYTYKLFSEFAKYTGGFYLFFSIDNISNKFDNFVDEAHPNKKSTDFVFDTNKDWGKYFVTSETVKQRLDLLWKKIEKE